MERGMIICVPELEKYKYVLVKTILFYDKMQAVVDEERGIPHDSYATIKRCIKLLVPYGIKIEYPDNNNSNITAIVTSNEDDVVISPNLIRGSRLSRIMKGLAQNVDGADYDEYYRVLKMSVSLMNLDTENVMYFSTFNTIEEGTSIVKPFYTSTPVDEEYYMSIQPAYFEPLWNFNRRFLEVVRGYSLLKYKEINRNDDLFTCMSAEKIFQDTSYSEMYMVIEEHRDENGTPLSIKSLKVYYKHQLQKLFDIELDGATYAVSV